MQNQHYDFIVSRSSEQESYQLWRFDPTGSNLLTEVSLGAEAKLDPKMRFTPIGDYILIWGPNKDKKNPLSYELRHFDPTSDNPLSGTPVQQGLWSNWKFFHGHLDFGHFGDHYKDRFKTGAIEFVSMGNYILAWVPTPGRGTFGLWKFDPQNNDPLPEKMSEEGAWGTIQTGHRLIPVGGYVIDWVPETGDYALWSFDPQEKNPLSLPTVQEGTWQDIGVDHELVPIGNYILDWQPATKAYRLWHFDPQQTNPLQAVPGGNGTLPDSFTADTMLTGIQPLIPVDEKAAAQPGTIDYMRSKIKHVVYYMLENRSFDHICGWLYDNENAPAHIIGGKGPFDGASTDFYNWQVEGDKIEGKKINLSLYKDGKLGDDFNLQLLPQDPYHDNSDVLRQMFYTDEEGYQNRSTPNMGGFVWNNGYPQVMETYGPHQTPVLSGLAGEFAVSDEWFCSMPGGTDVNRAFSLTGSSYGMLNNFQNGLEYKYWPYAPHRPPIWKALWDNGFTDWKIYNSVIWMDFVFSYHLFLQGHIPSVDAEIANARKEKTQSKYLADIDQFYADAAAGNLAKFTYIEPVWIAKTGTTSYHPGADIIPGEDALNKLFNALQASPCWDETLLVITFDEHGGIFDHVPPPRARKPYANDINNDFEFDIMGVRVPTILVSPMIEQHTLFRSETDVPYDATSILATLLEWHGVPKERWGLGERITAAPTFEGVIRRESPRKETYKFPLPYDATHKQNGAVEGGRLDDLQRTMGHRLVQTLGNGKMTDHELQKAADDISQNATSEADLFEKISDFHAKVGD